MKFLKNFLMELLVKFFAAASAVFVGSENVFLEHGGFRIKKKSLAFMLH